jgi:hypothetical protein
MPHRAEVANAVRKRHPYALCYACLAAALGLTEAGVRDAAQALMTGSFTTEQRQCPNCLQADKLLVFKDASASSGSPPLFP